MAPFRFALTVSLAVLSAAALALPSPPCHGGSGDTHAVSALGETYEQAAGLARNLVKATGVGTFMSLMNNRRGDVLEGTVAMECCMVSMLLFFSLTLSLAPPCILH